MFRDPDENSFDASCVEKLCIFNKRVAKYHGMDETALTWKSLA